MLERETEIIIQILTESTIADRETIALNEILTASIPKGVKTYIQTDVRRSLNDEIKKSPRFSRVNRTAPGIGQLERTLLRSLAVEYTMPREEFIATLENSVHFLENYLCRPQWTLNQLMFEQKESIPVDELLSKLDYVSDYSYFSRLIEAYVRQKGWMEASAEDFRRLVAKIDDQVVRQHNARQLALLTKPIYDFLLLSDAPLNRPIPLSPVLVFFADKGLTPYKNYIERICHLRSRSEISLAELIGIMEDLTQMEAQVSAPENGEKATAEPTLTVEDESGESIPTDKHVETGEEVGQEGDGQLPRDEPHQEPATREEEAAHVEETVARDSDQDELEEGSEPANPQPGQVDTTGKNIALSLTYSGMTETRRSEPLPDINDIIEDSHRAKFIKKIFMKDEGYYGVFIATLNKTQSWPEATVYLNELYKLNDLDPLAEVVVEFTDAIQRRYEPSNPS